MLTHLLSFAIKNTSSFYHLSSLFALQAGYMVQISHHNIDVINILTFGLPAYIVLTSLKNVVI